ncbi:MAG: hypothetical protein IJY61_04250 [Candidatus Gastranaerophilales bacterium]|nr:hypothetical protein [Candidatus Gastranaerophilales bacterium]
MKIIFSFVILFNLALSSYANCYTGFACSIASIENEAQKQFDEFSQKLDRYFSKKINEDFFFSKNPSELSYNDLFIFSTVV